MYLSTSPFRRTGKRPGTFLSGKDTHYRSTIPDLVIMDLNLPKMHGFEVLTRMKDRSDLSTIPVVILTGSLNADDERKARSMGAIDYWRKPTRKEEDLRPVNG